MSLLSEEKKSIASFILSILALTFSISALLMNIYTANKNEQLLNSLLHPAKKEELSKQSPSVHDDKYFFKIAGVPVSNCNEGYFISTVVVSNGFSLMLPLYSHDGGNIICLKGKPATLNGIQISDKELSIIEQETINRNIKKSNKKIAPIPTLDLGSIKLSRENFNKYGKDSADVFDEKSNSVIKMAGVPLQKCEEGNYIELFVSSKGFTYLIPLYSKGKSIICKDNKPSLNGVILTEKEIGEIEKAVIDESIKS